jgi:iron complex transport system ATP-binding protein
MDALELIDEVRHERSLTILSAIHDLTLAGQFADRLLLLADGQIAASGSAPEVLRESALAVHFGAGVQVLTTEAGDIAVISRRASRGRSGDHRDRAHRDDDRDPEHDQPGTERYALHTEAER